MAFQLNSRKCHDITLSYYIITSYKHFTYHRLGSRQALLIGPSGTQNSRPNRQLKGYFLYTMNITPYQ